MMKKFGTENMKVLVYPKPPGIFKNITSFVSSLASSAFLLIRSALKNMNMECWWYGAGRGRPEYS
jgi:hypothetical protein